MKFPARPIMFPAALLQTTDTEEVTIVTEHVIDVEDLQLVPVQARSGSGFANE
jgi:hypothetical protein